MVVLTPEEGEARSFLEGLDLEVSAIPPGAGKTPEFIVTGDGCGYVVEVKSRQDTKEWTRSLDRREVALQCRALGFDRWTMDVASGAIKQCRSIDPEHGRWWVLWVSVSCRAGGDAMFEQVIGSLLGVRQVVYLENASDEHSMRDCLGVVPGVFERRPELVAVVVSRGDGITRCVNDSAADIESFRDSVLCRSFAAMHPPISARYLEEHSGFLSIDARVVDRRDEAAMALYLEQKYAFEKAIIINMTTHTAEVAVARNTDSENTA